MTTLSLQCESGSQDYLNIDLTEETGEIRFQTTGGGSVYLHTKEDINKLAELILQYYEAIE